MRAVDAPVRRQAGNKLPSILLATLHQRPFIAKALGLNAWGRYAFGNQSALNRLGPLLRQPLIRCHITNSIGMTRHRKARLAIGLLQLLGEFV